MGITYLDEEKPKSKIQYLDEQPTPEQPQKQPIPKQSLLSMLGQAAMSGPVGIMAGEANPMEDKFISSAVNSAMLGTPELLLGKRPQPQSGAESIASGLGTMAGFAAPGALVEKGAKSVIKGAGVGAKLARGATTGAVMGAVIPPEESFTDLAARGKNAVLGALLGTAISGVGLAGTAIKQAKKTVSPEHANKLAQDLRGAFVDVKRAATDKFGSQIERLSRENPTRKVDLSEIAKDINSELDGYTSEAKNILKKVPGVEWYNGNIILTDQVDVVKVQDMINYVNTKIPANIKYQHLDILDFVYDLKAKQLEAFDEMSAIRGEYAKVIKPYKEIKNQFKFNRLLNAVNNDFGGPEGKAAVKEVFKDNPEVLKQMGSYKQAVKNVKAGKELLNALIKNSLIGTAIGGGAYTAYKVGHNLSE